MSIWRITTYFVLWMSIPSLMTSAVASVCLRDVGVCVLVDFIVRVAVLVIPHRLQLLPCHLFPAPIDRVGRALHFIAFLYLISCTHLSKKIGLTLVEFTVQPSPRRLSPPKSKFLSVVRRPDPASRW